MGALYSHPLLGVAAPTVTPVRTGGSTGRIGDFGLTRRRGDGSLRMHNGVDLLAPVGWPVFASHSGQVTFAGQARGYGLLVKIVRIVNELPVVGTRYAHLSELFSVVGSRVSDGDLIGRVGQTGNADATPPHLHFEFRERRGSRWHVVDPVSFIHPSTDSTRHA